MKSPFIDTNIFLRFLIKDPINPHLNEQAKKVILEIERGDLFAQTHLLIIAELIYVLESYYEKSHQEIIELVEPLIILDGIFFPDGQ